MTRTTRTMVLGLTAAVAALGFAVADEPKLATATATRKKTLADLRAAHAERLRELDRLRMTELAAFAATAKGEEADEAYEELFHIAMARNLYRDAEAAGAKRALDPAAPLSGRALAALVNVISKADRGQYEDSLQSLASFLMANAARVADGNEQRLDEATAITLGEAYLQRLFAARRYDLARKVGELINTKVNRPAIQEHFQARMRRLDLIGKPAPAIEGLNLDGKPVKLSDFAGKVVLVDFWAAWCPPCLEAIPNLLALQEAYGKDGFVILGVNLDAARAEVGTVEKAKPLVRRLVVSAGISWPNILATMGDDSPASTYKVTDIPANFLIGRDGTVKGFELDGATIRSAIEEELGKGGK